MFTALRLLRNAVLFGRRRRFDSTRPTRRVRLVLEELETRTVPSSVPVASLAAAPLAYPAISSSVAPPFTPAEIQGAYSVPTSVSNLNGTTIAIVDAYDDPHIGSDLAAFDAQYKIAAAPSFTKVDENGPNAALPQPNSGWAVEISLDVEWAHAIDPTANILLVEANSASLTDLMTAVGYAAKNANVVSMSWGGSEFSGETSAVNDGVFAAYANGTNAKNVTFVASSGDDRGVEWPASSPYVLAVGGTSLTVDTTPPNSYGGETAWSDGGGGVSTVEGQPSYQGGVQSDGARTTPDVSYDANPNTGVSVYDTYAEPGWGEVGGTSVGAPQWSAVVALADQARGAALNTAQVENTLYGLTYNHTSTPTSGYGAYFHDVTTGSNGYRATTGYDLATGLGSPVANSLISALADSTFSSSFTPGPAPGHGGGGGGGGGGGRGGGRLTTTDPTTIVIESEAPAVVAVVSASATTPSFSPHATIAAATPVSNVPAVASLGAGSAYLSGGGGALAGDQGPADQAAPTGAAVAPEGAGNLPWLSDLFTEAVRRLKVPSTATPPGLMPAAPMNHDGPSAPMKESSAPAPSGKGDGAILLEKGELYAVPAALGLVGAGLEREERRRRERLLEKPR